MREIHPEVSFSLISLSKFITKLNVIYNIYDVEFGYIYILGDFKLGKEATEITVKGLNSTAWPGQLKAKR